MVFWAAFRRNMLPPSSLLNCEDTSMLKMETCLSKTLATVYKTTRKHNPGDHSLNIHHLENPNIGIYFRKTWCCCIRIYEACTSSIFVLMWLIKNENLSRDIVKGVEIIYYQSWPMDQLHMRVVSKCCCAALLQFNDLLASSFYLFAYNQNVL
jgi:hypothetical protein